MAYRPFDPEAQAIDATRQQALRRVEKLSDLPDCFARRDYIGEGQAAGWIFTWHQPDGAEVPQFRSDHPPLDEKGKPRKYLFPKDCPGLLSIPPDYKPRVMDPTIPLVVVEGSAQHLAVASALSDEPIAVVGISGCNGWSKERIPAEAWRQIPLMGRQTFLVPDRDMRTKPGVHRGFTQLAGFLRAELLVDSVRYIHLPGSGGDSNSGADDILSRVPLELRTTAVLGWINDATTDPGPVPPAELTAIEALDLVKSKAAEIVAKVSDASDHLVLLRAEAGKTSVRFADTELRQILKAAANRHAGISQLRAQGDTLDRTPAQWFWAGVVMQQRCNLVIGPPKTGKTTLFVEMISRWSKGCPSFLGQPLVGQCPPVMIVGTDMPESDWTEALIDSGLVSPVDLKLRPPLVGLATAGNPIHLDTAGIERIKSVAAENPGLLILVDSYSRCVAPLGIAEKDEQIAAPLQSLVEAVTPFGATVVLIHHTNKSATLDDTPSSASRGNNSLPAYASQIVELRKTKGANGGKQILLRTEGRGGAEFQLFYERDGKDWICHGNAAEVMRREQLLETEERLNDRQTKVLDLARSVWADQSRGVVAQDVARALVIDEANARRTLRQLKTKELLVEHKETTLQGQRCEYRPVELEVRSPEEELPVCTDLVDLSDRSDLTSSEGSPDSIPSPRVKLGGEVRKVEQGEVREVREVKQVSTHGIGHSSDLTSNSAPPSPDDGQAGGPSAQPADLAPTTETEPAPPSAEPEAPKVLSVWERFGLPKNHANPPGSNQRSAQSRRTTEQQSAPPSPDNNDKPQGNDKPNGADSYPKPRRAEPSPQPSSVSPVSPIDAMAASLAAAFNGEVLEATEPDIASSTLRLSRADLERFGCRVHWLPEDHFSPDELLVDPERLDDAA